MALDFPTAPSTGTTYTASNVTWVWDGSKWEMSATASGPFVPLSGYVPAAGSNRIINGDMRIDQRNNGAATTPISNAYPIDRWKYQATQASLFGAQRNTSAPGVLGIGIGYYLALGTTPTPYAPLATDYFLIQQPIEADMISDLAWGTSGAQPVTLSFWASSNLAGTFGGSIANAAATRSYPFTFQLAANTWTKIAITIPGDIAGSWVLQGNAASLCVRFDLGSGANYVGPAGVWASTNYVGSTGCVPIVNNSSSFLQLSNVKLEIGSIATPFNMQSLAKSLIDCQRYFTNEVNIVWSGQTTNGSIYYVVAYFKVSMRGTPTITMNYSNASSFPSTLPTATGITSTSFQANLPAANATATSSFYQFGYSASAEL
jgi:hypothetical protein